MIWKHQTSGKVLIQSGLGTPFQEVEWREDELWRYVFHSICVSRKSETLQKRSTVAVVWTLWTGVGVVGYPQRYLCWDSVWSQQQGLKRQILHLAMYDQGLTSAQR
jgi:hypothetical protein